MKLIKHSPRVITLIMRAEFYILVGEPKTACPKTGDSVTNLQYPFVKIVSEQLAINLVIIIGNTFNLQHITNISASLK